MFHRFSILLGLLIGAILLFILSLFFFVQFIAQATMILLAMALLCSIYKPRNLKILHKKAENKKFDPNVMLRQGVVRGKIVEFRPREKGQK